MGESTCACKLVALPISDPSGQGKAKLHISTLMELAMERCSTSRCAVELMGAMAMQHGFYGPDASHEECGEGLTIADGEETW
jgi:dipeptidase